jgi:molybdopterin converting factor small subunit
MGSRQPVQARDTGPLDNRLAAAREAAAELREVTRAAHEAAQGLRDATRDARELLASMRPDVTERIDAVVNAGLAQYTDTLDTAMKAGERAMLDRFDRFIAELLGDGQGPDSLEEILKRHLNSVTLLQAQLEGRFKVNVPVERIKPGPEL